MAFGKDLTKTKAFDLWEDEEWERRKYKELRSWRRGMTKMPRWS